MDEQGISPVSPGLTGLNPFHIAASHQRLDQCQAQSRSSTKPYRMELT